MTQMSPKPIRHRIFEWAAAYLRRDGLRPALLVAYPTYLLLYRPELETVPGRAAWVAMMRLIFVLGQLVSLSMFGAFVLGFIAGAGQSTIGHGLFFVLALLCTLAFQRIVNLRDDSPIRRAFQAVIRQERARIKRETARHADTRDMEQMVLEWWEAHKNESGMTKDKAAEQMAGKLVPLKFRTVRDYLKGV